MASSHAYALVEPAGWDKMREMTRARFKARYGKEVPAHPKVAEEPMDVRVQRYRRVAAGFDFFRKTLREKRPDALLIIGDDQDENFNEHNLPQIAMYVGGDFFNMVREPTGQRSRGPRYRSHTDLANALLDGLVAREFDAAIMRSFPRDELLSHAHAQILSYFLPEADIPVVLLFVNAIHVPGLSPKRAHGLGRALRDIIEERPGGERVMVYASGGLSHFTSSFPWEAYGGPFTVGSISEEFDRRALEYMSQGRGDKLTELTAKDLVDNGDTEMISWLVLLGAVGKVPARVLAYEPLYSGLTGMGVAYWDVEARSGSER
jgi:aromatic ring-opening dioxygenase catalytic subunit (LigB family)